MLIGAGDAGAIALLEFQNSQHSSNQVVCIIDDASRKRGQLLRGVPIVGGRESILAAAEKYRIQEIVLAIPSASSRQQRAILSICQKTKCTLRTLPVIYHWQTERSASKKSATWKLRTCWAATLCRWIWQASEACSR